MQRIFVTGIGTDIGKTVVAAILVEALHADYWKPIQAGNLESGDSASVRSLISNPLSRIHPERFRLTQPLSPHAAAKIDGVEINISDFKTPQTENHLVIEGAGGLMVPLSNSALVIDLIARLECHIVLVSKVYLGSINHTLLSLEAIRSRGLPLCGIIFNGTNPESERIILEHGNVPCLGTVHEEQELVPSVIKRYAHQFRGFFA